MNKFRIAEGILNLLLPGLLWISIRKDLPSGFWDSSVFDFELHNPPLDSNTDLPSKAGSWKMHSLDADPSSGSDGVKLADVNGDGFSDLVSGFEEDGVSQIYLHPGYENAQDYWEFIELPSPDVEDAVLVDLDNNGITDLVTASEGNTNQIRFHWASDPQQDYTNPRHWKTQVIPATDDVTAWMFVIPADMDGKNGIDLIVGSKRKRGVTGDDQALVGWLQSPEDSRSIKGWKYFPLNSAGWIMSIEFIDMNDDGRPDILISDRKFSSQSGVRWLENPGKNTREFYGKWKSQMLGVSEGEPMFFTLPDLDGNGLEEILIPDPYNGLVILKQPDPPDLLWNSHLIPYPSWSGGRGKAVSVGDINLDGRPEVVLSFEEEGKVASIPYEEYKSKGKYSVILGKFSGSPFFPENWTFEKISGMRGKKFDLVSLIDLDGDGDLDVLTNDENEEGDGLGVIWYENPTKYNSRLYQAPTALLTFLNSFNLWL